MPTVRNYLSLIKFSHTIFAMPFAMIGFFLGAHPYKFPYDNQWNLNRTVGWDKEGQLVRWNDHLWVKLIFVILCMVFARSAAMAFNRWLDREFDAKNPRTAIREIPMGIIKANIVLVFTVINCLLFITTAFFLNKLCFFLSPIALLIVLGYSYTKRFTPFCHLILGLGLSLAPIGAYIAVTGHSNFLPVLFSLAVMCWVGGFDIIYAMQDIQFDKEQKLYSMPTWLGLSKGLRISELLHLLAIFFIAYAGWSGRFGWLYWTGFAVFTGLLIYQHIIVKPRDLSKVNIAFMTLNGIASILFSIFVIADIYLIRFKL